MIKPSIFLEKLKIHAEFGNLFSKFNSNSQKQSDMSRKMYCKIVILMKYVVMSKLHAYLQLEFLADFCLTFTEKQRWGVFLVSKYVCHWHWSSKFELLLWYISSFLVHSLVRFWTISKHSLQLFYYWSGSSKKVGVE